MADIRGVPRQWWGKIIGGLIGLFRGGLSGAVIGLLFGHFIDRFLAGFVGVAATREAFFDALFGTLGHLAKADGRVSEHEIQVAEQLMARMQISGAERQRAIRLFNRGKQADFDLAAALGPFVRHALARPDLRRMFLEILVDATFAGGGPSRAEGPVLQRIALELHVPPEWLEAMLRMRAGAGTQGRQRGGGVVRGTLEQAYAQLGLSPQASAAEIKKTYRRLVSQYHPDKLVSRGLPEEMMEIARTRVRDINTAYDQIKAARGFK